MNPKHHSHNHEHDVERKLTFQEKTVKMLEHWIKHNQDHAENYNKWAKEVKDNLGDSIYTLLKDAADLTLSINEKFEEAVKRIEKIDK